MMRMVRAAFGSNNIDHRTRLCHSTSVAATGRALSTSAASGSMREIEEARRHLHLRRQVTTETLPGLRQAYYQAGGGQGGQARRGRRAPHRLAAHSPTSTRRCSPAPTWRPPQRDGTEHIIAQGLHDQKFIAGRTRLRQAQGLGRAITPSTWGEDHRDPRRHHRSRGRDVRQGLQHLDLLGRWGSPSTRPGPTSSPPPQLLPASG